LSDPKTIILNVHIPKTAGSSFRRRLARTLPPAPGHARIRGVNCPANPRDTYFDRLRQRAIEVLAEVADDHAQLVSGHFRYRDIAALIPPLRRKLILTTTVRDPVDRYLSDYLYCCSDAHNAKASFVRAYPDFAAYLADPAQDNKQLDYLRPFEGASVRDTIDFMRETFDFVGVTDRLDSDFVLFARGLGLTPAEPERRNVGQNKAQLQDLRDAHGAQIADRHTAERELCEALAKIDWTSRTHDIPGAPKASRAMTELTEDDQRLRREIEALGPWHHHITVNDRLVTRAMDFDRADPDAIAVTDPHAIFATQALPLFPEGMNGLSFLDCGCNAGGYCFAAKDAGADTTFGFDVRQHWIDQANFLRRNRAANSDGMRFEVADLLGLKAMDEKFDVTWFSGLLYHLPDPVQGLRIAADKTREMIFVNTSVQEVLKGEEEQMTLRLKFEGVEQVMSGVHHLSWLPGGPASLRLVLEWLGFPETRLLFWHKQTVRGIRSRSGRLAMVAARTPGRLDAIKDAEPVDYLG
jgi:SAM-dependent methyltransferase